VLGLQMEAADGRAGHLRQFDGAHLGLVDGAARAVGGKDGGTTTLNDVRQSHHPTPPAVAAGTAHGVIAKKLQDTRNQFSVKALAYNNHGAGMAVVNRTGQHALVPQAVDPRPRPLAKDNGRGSLFGNHLKAPGAADYP